MREGGDEVEVWRRRREQKVEVTGEGRGRGPIWEPGG